MTTAATDQTDRVTSPKVLVVEDDPNVRSTLEQLLRFEGYEVCLAGDGREALDLLETDRPDLAVVDVVMPRMDGLSLCRTLRLCGDRLPILVLTARGLVGDRVAGLDAGADDYLAKPFDTEELLARLRALLRRSAPDEPAVLTVADLSLNPATREVRRGDRVLELTRTEFDVLELLLRNAPVVLTKGQIYEHIWGYDFDTESRSLDVYIGYLRRKTEEGGAPRLIQTVRNVGFTVKAV
ncbi:response regulator transcription factor [Nocardia seriolae]|uniref:Histidine kinase n=1 Tax=Nocardia seriolae TaxID=37332 RepID=A0A0B8NMA4_9NOCA|nr:Histidine kinase [Nocardia seriolae]GEM27490.1 response regulator MprA [Nocardia seriolae NBRC 15557]MTJ65080.1 response regulator [Nocardia seriolae]MTJ75033.1 response regulator [Nocardia seriolae]MTJ86995.1 response regulator [Nocardia seriolae]